MANLIPSVAPVAPRLGGRAVARPTRASTANAMVGAQNAMNGWHALQHGVVNYQIAAGADESSDAATIDDTLMPARWRRSSAGRYVWVGLWLLAEEGKGSPSIELELQETDGTTIDGPIEWSFANNFLPLQPSPRDGGVIVIGESRDTLVETGWSIRPIGTLPRMFDMNNADDGAEVQLVVTDVTDVRLYSLSWEEGYFDSLPL